MWPGQFTTPLARVKWRPFFPGAPDPLAPLPAQRQSGALLPAAGVRHISHRRFMATFSLVAVSREDQDLYRCVSQAPRGAGVSNFAELIVKGERAVGLRGAGRAKVEWAWLLPGGGVSSMGVAHGRAGKAESDFGCAPTSLAGLAEGVSSPGRSGPN